MLDCLPRTVEGEEWIWMGCRRDVPTALSSMIPWALVFAADMATGLTRDPKRRRRNEMVGKLISKRWWDLDLGLGRGFREMYI